MYILLADDHELILNGVQLILEDSKRFDGIECVQNGTDAFQRIQSGKFDLAVLDIEMPGMSALEILEKLPPENPCKIIILSAYEDLSLIKRALRLGARSYLLKRSSPHSILGAVEKVLNGGVFVSDDITEQLLLEPSFEEIKPNEIRENKFDRLSERELEIVGLIVAGLNNPQIAEKLFISRRTVDTHRSNLMKKLDIHSTVELVKLALEQGL
ncbi:MAG: response regulator transcription factor [Bacteroidetes bacterium]|nr:MAG: response regulator transcription factor [Bacteroidota bacterium]